MSQTGAEPVHIVFRPRALNKIKVLRDTDRININGKLVSGLESEPGGSDPGSVRLIAAFGNAAQISDGIFTELFA
jgi:hypothetical protein